MTSIDRTAYPRFERVSVRDVVDVFTPTAEEIAWAREKTTIDAHLLALAAWLKSYQYLGYFAKLDQVPAPALAHLREALGLAEDVLCEVDADRTAKRHREFIRTRLGVKYDQAESRKIAEEAIRTAAQSKDSPADLIHVALEQLIRKRRELPGFSTLNDMAATIRTEINKGVFATVAARIPADARAKLLRLLVVDPAVRRSQFDRLKDPAKAATIGKLKARLKHLADLDAIGPTEAWLAGVPMGEDRALRRRGEADGRERHGQGGEAKRLTLLAAMVHTLRISARDEVCDMVCKRMAVIHRKGRERLEELREAHRAESERLLEVFGDVLAAAREATADADDEAEPGAGRGDRVEMASSVGGVDVAGQETARRTGELVLKALESGGGLRAPATAHEAVAAHHGNNYLPLVERFYKSHRSALFTLVDAVVLEATSAERAVVDAVAFIRANRDRRGEWIEETTVHVRGGENVVVAVNVDAFASEMWRKTLRDKRRPGMLPRRHLEVCVFSHLAAELRSGDIAVVGSDSYANLYDQLMSWDECAPHIAELCDQAGIPADAAELAAHYRGLLDILARSAYLTGWTRHFGLPSGSDPKIRDAMGRYVVTAFAYGGNLGPTEVARHMRGVSAHEISTAGNKHADPNKIHRAFVVVIDAFAKLDVAGMWGDGRTAAADGSQIDSWENNLLAESHIRYGGFGGIAYRLISDTYVALFSRFIPCGVWEAVYLLDLLLSNDSAIRPDSVHNYATWLMIGGRLIGRNDPDYQERVVKFNELIANAAIYSTALDITDAANALAAEGHPVNTDDLATIIPYITRTIRRFGDWVLDLAPPEANPATKLDLQPAVLFPAMA